MLRWRNLPAIKKIDLVANYFGRPGHLWNKEGGAAIWDTQDLADKKLFGMPVCMKRVEVRDELIHHTDSANSIGPGHQDSIYFYYDLQPDVVQLNQIMALTSAVGYNENTHQLWVRCDKIGVNIAIALVAAQITAMEMTASQCRELYTNVMRQIGAEQTKVARLRMTRDIYVSLCGLLQQQSRVEKFADGHGSDVWDIYEPETPRVYRAPVDHLKTDTPGLYGPSYPRGRLESRLPQTPTQTAMSRFVEDQLWQAMHEPEKRSQLKHDFPSAPLRGAALPYNP